MTTLTIRASRDLLRTLERLRVARGLRDRSAAVRVAIREAALAPEARAAVPDRDELLRLLGDAARDGSVVAMKALLDEQRRGEAPNGQPRSRIEALVERRRAETSSHLATAGPVRANPTVASGQSPGRLSGGRGTGPARTPNQGGNNHAD